MSLTPHHLDGLHVLLTLCLVVSLAVNRYLAVDPGFNILTRAAGQLTLWITHPFRRCLIIYADNDRLSLVNDALTSGNKLGHDRLNKCMRWVFQQLRGTDRALVYGGDEWRILAPAPWWWQRLWWQLIRKPRTLSGYGLCERLQHIAAAYPWSEDEQARLLTATGKPYVTFTLAYTENVPYFQRQVALGRCKVAVGMAKPKNAPGQRGSIIAL